MSHEIPLAEILEKAPARVPVEGQLLVDLGNKVGRMEVLQGQMAKQLDAALERLPPPVDTRKKWWSIFILTSVVFSWTTWVSLRIIAIDQVLVANAPAIELAVDVDRRLAAIEANRFTAADGIKLLQALADHDAVAGHARMLEWREAERRLAKQRQEWRDRIEFKLDDLRKR